MIHVVLEGEKLVYVCDNKIEAIGLSTLTTPEAKIVWPGCEELKKEVTTLTKAPSPEPTPVTEVPKKGATKKVEESEEDKKRKRYLRDVLKKMGKTYKRGTTLETLEAEYKASKPADDLIDEDPPKTMADDDILNEELPGDDDGLFGEEEPVKAPVKEITKEDMRAIITGVLRDDNNDITSKKAKAVLLEKFKKDKLDELEPENRPLFLEALGIAV